MIGVNIERMKVGITWFSRHNQDPKFINREPERPRGREVNGGNELSLFTEDMGLLSSAPFPFTEEPRRSLSLTAQS